MKTAKAINLASALKIKGNSFIRSVAVLMTGTVIAQLIAYLITPILTRIYNGEEMGELGVYMRAVGFIAALATARFELALPLPGRDQHAYLLYRLALRIAVYTFAACALLFGVFLLFREPEVNDWQFAAMTLVSAAFLVLTNLGTNWAIRKEKYQMISSSRIVNSTVANGLRWGFGLLNFGAFGLLLASTIGYALASLAFVRQWFQLDATHKLMRSARKTRALSIRYKEFPMYNFPHVLVDLGRDLLIAGLVVAFFSKAVFGYYNHSYTMLRLPLVVVGASIGQVFFSRAADAVNQGASMLPLLLRTMRTLALISLLPFALILFYGEPLFAIVFGEEWGESGRYAEIMALWLMFNFVTSAVSTAPMVLNRQRTFFLISLVGTVLQLLGFGLLPLWLGTDESAFREVLLAVAASQAVYMLVVAYLTIHYARKGVLQAREKRTTFDRKD